MLLVLRACETSAGSETKDLRASLNFNLVDPESFIYIYIHIHFKQ